MTLHVPKIYRCCRCNAELKLGERYTSHERIVTRQSFNSGRDYKVRAFPRYHADETTCDQVRGIFKRAEGDR